MPLRLRLVILASIVGFLVSLHLALYTYGISPWLGCLEYFDCAAVSQSKYARLYGIPNSVLGVIGYAAMFLVTTFLLFTYVNENGNSPNDEVLRRRKVLSIVLFGLAAVAFSQSAYLTYAEFFIIDAICQWCIVSALMTLVIFAASLADLARRGWRPQAATEA